MADARAVPLIGLAHGSRHLGVVGSVTRLMATASRMGEMPTVGAFLDLAAPDLVTVATQLSVQGYRRAVVAPLLFTEAYHATVDIPRTVREAAELSGLELTTTAILGTGDDILQVVREGMATAGIGDTESVLLLAVGSSSSAANDAILDFALRLGCGRTGRVAAAFGTRSPRAGEVLPQLPMPVAIVPLFVSPGLLLEPLVRLAFERQLTFAPPLGDLIAPVLVHRYRQAFAGAAS
jgi:sirohydrochlorin ferrochelatase